MTVALKTGFVLIDDPSVRRIATFVLQRTRKNWVLRSTKEEECAKNVD
jgi:hypothetical protein